MSLRLGVDLGGTKIEIAALDAAGAERYRRRIATPAHDYGATVESIGRLVEDAERELGTRGTVGVGMPGALSLASGRVKNANSTWLNGRDFRGDLEARLGREVRLANDANCFALSEAIDGAGRGADVVFGVILGTGVGGAIVVRREVLGGANAIAGEWGHNPLPAPGPEDEPLPTCYCGRRGCIETYLSGPALAAERTRSGDAAFERYERRLARALATVINIVDPDVIVLGGGLSSMARLYANVPRLWASHVFSDEVRTTLLPPVHGDASGVRGAAWLWNTT